MQPVRTDQAGGHLSVLDAVRRFSDQPGWRATVYPTAGEGSVTFRASRRPRCRISESDSSRTGAARAQSVVRRRCVHGGLTRIVALTFAARVMDPAQVHHAVMALLAKYRRQLGVPFPFVWVIEPHEDNRLHVHVAVRPQDVRLADLWTHGRADR